MAFVGVNERGLRVGQDHHRAKLTDADIDMLLALHEEGWGYRRLAAKFEISRSHAQRLCKGRQRSQRVASWKKVQVPK